MNKIYLWIISKLTKRLINGKCQHKENLVDIYSAIRTEVAEKFQEDNAPTLNLFLRECQEKGLSKIN